MSRKLSRTLAPAYAACRTKRARPTKTEEESEREAAEMFICRLNGGET
jgi:hypothetical protein